MTRPDDPKAKSDVCPKCGGKLRFNRAPGGSGQTVEQCENLRLSTVKPGVNIGTCDHFTVLEPMRHPAHTRAPRGPEAPRPGSIAAERLQGPRRTPRTQGMRGATLVKVNRVLLALADSPDQARTNTEIAATLRIPVENAYRYLETLVAHGRAASRPRPRLGKFGRPAIEYWRISVAEVA